MEPHIRLQRVALAAPVTPAKVGELAPALGILFMRGAPKAAPHGLRWAQQLAGAATAATERGSQQTGGRQRRWWTAAPLNVRGRTRCTASRPSTTCRAVSSRPAPARPGLSPPSPTKCRAVSCQPAPARRGLSPPSPSCHAQAGSADSPDRNRCPAPNGPLTTPTPSEMANAHLRTRAPMPRVGLARGGRLLHALAALGLCRAVLPARADRIALRTVCNPEIRF